MWPLLLAGSEFLSLKDRVFNILSSGFFMNFLQCKGSTSRQIRLMGVVAREAEELEALCEEDGIGVNNGGGEREEFIEREKDCT